ncbi:MAG: DUF2442 domain-containing protein [Kiritimatiellae bacterium]|nr:DUF2442 domain-containing protein [Kiritimatiellia bacterium]
MYRKTESVEPLVDYKLLVTYEGGERRVFDVTPYLGRGVFVQLQDELAFKSVHVAFDTIQWDNGADICPEVLYADSVPVASAQKVAEQRAEYGSGATRRGG